MAREGKRLRITSRLPTRGRFTVVWEFAGSPWSRTYRIGRSGRVSEFTTDGEWRECHYATREVLQIWFSGIGSIRNPTFYVVR
jgi:hypothetical protein